MRAGSPVCSGRRYVLVDALESRTLFAFTYTITPLGTTSNTPAVAAVGYQTLNNTYLLENNPTSATSGVYTSTLIKGKTRTPIPAAGPRANAQDVSENGIVALYSQGNAYKWVSGVLTKLGLGSIVGLSPNGKHAGGTKAVLVNGKTEYHGWDWFANKDLGVLPGKSSTVWAINDTGVAVGQGDNDFGDVPFYWDGTKQVQIGSAEGVAAAINNAGLAVGYFTAPAGNQQAFSFNTKTKTLASLPAPTEAGGTGAAGWAALDINNAGQSVGWTDTNKTQFTSAKKRAVLWENGTAIDLNTLIPASSGITLAFARAINDKGQILCAGIPKGAAATATPTTAYLLTPNRATLASNGTLSIRGTSADDVVSVALKGTKISVSINGAGQTFSKTSVKRMAIDVLGGNDTVTIGAGTRAANILGGSGNDVFNIRNSIKDIVDGQTGTDKAKIDAGIDQAAVESLIP